MLINRQKLLDTAKATVQKRHEDYEKAVKDWAEALVGYREKWVRGNNHKWAATLPRLDSAIKAGEPVTRDMLPLEQGRWGTHDISFYSEPGEIKVEDGRTLRKPVQMSDPDREMNGFIAILEAISDDEVSPTGLKAVGVNPTVMRSIVQKIGSQW